MVEYEVPVVFVEVFPVREPQHPFSYCFSLFLSQNVGHESAPLQDVMFEARHYPLRSTCRAIWPAPSPHFQPLMAGMSSPCFCDVLLVIDQLVVDRLLEVRGPGAELRQPVDHVFTQVEAVQVVHHDHVERRRRRAFFLVAAHVQVLVIRAPVGQAMDQPRVAVESEDDRLVLGEQSIEVVIRQSVRMLALLAAASSGSRR